MLDRMDRRPAHGAAAARDLDLGHVERIDRDHELGQTRLRAMLLQVLQVDAGCSLARCLDLGIERPRLRACGILLDHRALDPLGHDAGPDAHDLGLPGEPGGRLDLGDLDPCLLGELGRDLGVCQSGSSRLRQGRNRGRLGRGLGGEGYQWPPAGSRRS